jgi:deoxycytidylate deaminase
VSRRKHKLRPINQHRYKQLPRFLQLAYKTAARSSEDFKLGAVLVRCGKPISMGYNKYNSTNKLVREFFGFATVHAECDAVYKAAGMDLRGCTIYVARARAFGEIGQSSPCTQCRVLLISKGVKKIVYSIPEFPFFAEERI